MFPSANDSNTIIVVSLVYGTVSNFLYFTKIIDSDNIKVNYNVWRYIFITFSQISSINRFSDWYDISFQSFLHVGNYNSVMGTYSSRNMIMIYDDKIIRIYEFQELEGN